MARIKLQLQRRVALLAGLERLIVLYFGADLISPIGYGRFVGGNRGVAFSFSQSEVCVRVSRFVRGGRARRPSLEIRRIIWWMDHEFQPGCLVFQAGGKFLFAGVQNFRIEVGFLR